MMKIKMLIVLSVVIFLCWNCSTNADSNMQQEEEVLIENKEFLLPDIDLNHWKVTLPIGNPSEVTPPEILDYAKNPILQKYMYNDSIDGSLVFYTEPGSSTPNAKYSRTELREQLVSGSNNTNWSFAEGGIMKGTLSMDEISKDEDGKYHSTIIMQIHGRLTDEQRDLIGEDDNNAPPVIKIYWDNGRLRVHRKILEDQDATLDEILKTSSWIDEKHWFETEVGFEKFELKIIASARELKVILNDQESFEWNDIHTEKWSVFENYFKAGNYLQTREEGAFARVKYYDLEVTH